MVNRPVLVLNQNYEPLNICRVKRAIPLLYQGKAELLENGRGFIHSIGSSFEIPSVIKMVYQIKRPRRIRKMTRAEIFNRDSHACQYCGKKERPLTLDHVVPRRLGGAHTWDNVVASCGHCNRRKAGRTPQQAGMKLLSQPRRPSSRLPFLILGNYLESIDEWQKYLPNN